MTDLLVPLEVISFIACGWYMNSYINYFFAFTLISVGYRIFFSPAGERLLRLSYPIIQFNFRINNLLDKDMPIYLFTYLVFWDWRLVLLLIFYLTFFKRHYFFSSFVVPNIRYKAVEPIYHTYILRIRYNVIPEIYYAGYTIMMEFYHKVLKWAYYNILTKIWGFVKLCVNYIIYYMLIVPLNKLNDLLKRLSKS